MNFEYNQELIRNINHWNMEIDDSGYVMLEHDGWRGRDVCSPYSRLYLVCGGEGELHVAGQRIPLLPGYAYFIPAGLTFDYGCAVTLEKLFFHLRLVKPDGYDLAHGLPTVAVSPLDPCLFAQMLTHYRGHCWGDALLLEQEIRSLVLLLLEQYPVLQEKIISYSPLTAKTMHYIHTHLQAGLTAGQIADAMFTPAATLSRRFRQETGRTIHQYLEDMVFQSACKRLAVSDQPLAQISEDLGFCDPFYFSRRFRQRYGETPSQYRRRLKL